MIFDFEFIVSIFLFLCADVPNEKITVIGFIQIFYIIISLLFFETIRKISLRE